MRAWFAAPLLIAPLLAVAACSNQAPPAADGNEQVVLRNLAETEVARPKPASLRVEGDLVPTPSDREARYYLLRERKTAAGTIIAVLRQERGDRIAYARTETDCARRLFHVIGTGATRGRVETAVAHDGPLRPIAGLPLREELAAFVCQRSGTPLAGA